MVDLDDRPEGGPVGSRGDGGADVAVPSDCLTGDFDLDYNAAFQHTTETGTITGIIYVPADFYPPKDASAPLDATVTVDSGDGGDPTDAAVVLDGGADAGDGGPAVDVVELGKGTVLVQYGGGNSVADYGANTKHTEGLHYRIRNLVDGENKYVIKITLTRGTRTLIGYSGGSQAQPVTDLETAKARPITVNTGCVRADFGLADAK